MKIVTIIPALAAGLLCFAQAPIAAPPAMGPGPESTLPYLPSRPLVAGIESAFESKLKALDPKDPVNLLGATAGVYVKGVGMFFTTPMDLVITPQLTPFHTVITPAEKSATHAQKQSHLPLLKKALADAVAESTAKLPPLPPGERVVFAARLYYFEWEDKAGLPSQIVASADRDSALARSVQVDEQ